MAIDVVTANTEMLETAALPVVNFGGIGTDVSPDCTFVAWFHDGSDVDGWVLSMGRTNSASRHMGLRVYDTAGSIEASAAIRASSHEQADAGNLLTTGWNHLCGRWDGGSAYRSIVLNGDLANMGTETTAIAGITNDGTPRVRIGNRASSQNGYCTGGIAECAIWEGQLEDADVVWLSRGYSPLFIQPGKLRLYVPLINPGDLGVDLIPPGEHALAGSSSMTITNAPAYKSHPDIIYPRWFNNALNTVGRLPHPPRAKVFSVPAAGPPVLSVPTEASITDTTVTVGCTTDDATGTMYYYISESATAPSVSNLKDGTGATKFGNDATISIPQTFAVTGLTASTTYYTYFIQNDGVDDSNLLESGSWATTAGGVSIPIAMHHYKQLMGAN